MLYANEWCANFVQLLNSVTTGWTIGVVTLALENDSDGSTLTSEQDEETLKYGWSQGYMRSVLGQMGPILICSQC